MALLASSKPFVAVNRTSSKVAPLRNVRAAAVSQKTDDHSRRNILAITTLSSLGSVLLTLPAHAFLGFGEDGQVEAKYQQETADMLAAVNKVMAIPKDAEGKEEAVKALRTQINNWVATYRREPKVAGRPSFGNMYSALNALAGHYNSFGPTAPIPKKRLERLEKELGDAQSLLARNR